MAVVKTAGKKAAAKPAADAKKTGSGRNVGKTSGLRIYEYQNQSLLANEKAKNTDEQLAKEWRAEFPKAMAFDAHMVRNVRNLYNRGKHKNDAPNKPLHGYDETGEQVPNRGEGKAAVAKAAAKPAKPTIVRKLKKTA